MKTILVSKKQVVSELAKWAVRQSPYTVPENLGIALQHANEFLTGRLTVEFTFGYYSLKEQDLSNLIYEMVRSVPEIKAWNQPKNKSQVDFVFVSLFDQPNPGDDFIDLDALAMNILTGLTTEG